MRYKSQEEAINDHKENYRSDGVMKGKCTRYSSDYYRGAFFFDNVNKDSIVFDVGCNGGTLSLPLMQEKNCYVNGIDVVEELVEKAKKRGVKAELGNAEDLSRFRDNDFDYVLCGEVLEHLYDPLPAIQEAYRVLKPGGKYIVSVPHPFSEMCNDKLGDYHQQNFSSEIIDTLFCNVFKREDVIVFDIPYSEMYCRANSKTKEEYEKMVKTPQWLGIIAKKGE